jgi:hypothetical protein
LLARVLASRRAALPDFISLWQRTYGNNVVTGTEAPIAESVLPALGLWMKLAFLGVVTGWSASPFPGTSPLRDPAVATGLALRGGRSRFVVMRPLSTTER